MMMLNERVDLKTEGTREGNRDECRTHLQAKDVVRTGARERAANV